MKTLESFWDHTDDRFEVEVFDDKVQISVYPRFRTKWSDGRPNTISLSREEARELGVILTTKVEAP